VRDCTFYDHAPTTTLDQPTSIRIPHDTKESIGTLQQFPSAATALLTDLTKARPLIRIELTVKTNDGGQLVSRLVDCALDFVSGDFVRRFALLL
jgi:hypothetical protein